jgi:hypothetical protein
MSGGYLTGWRALTWSRPSPVRYSRSRAGLRLAVAAYLARYKGQSRMHTDSDLRGFLDWCQERWTR